MIVLSKPQILMMHKSLIEETGGLDGIRDENLLDSAINAPFQKFDCQDLFPTVQQKAARLGYGIIKITLLLTVINALARTLCLFFLHSTELNLTTHKKNFTQQYWI